MKSGTIQTFSVLAILTVGSSGCQTAGTRHNRADVLSDSTPSTGDSLPVAQDKRVVGLASSPMKTGENEDNAPEVALFDSQQELQFAMGGGDANRHNKADKGMALAGGSFIGSDGYEYRYVTSVNAFNLNDAAYRCKDVIGHYRVQARGWNSPFECYERVTAVQPAIDPISVQPTTGGWTPPSTRFMYGEWYRLVGTAYVSSQQAAINYCSSNYGTTGTFGYESYRTFGCYKP